MADSMTKVAQDLGESIGLYQELIREARGNDAELQALEEQIGDDLASYAYRIGELPKFPGSTTYQRVEEHRDAIARALNGNMGLRSLLNYTPKQ